MSHSDYWTPYQQYLSTIDYSTKIVTFFSEHSEDYGLTSSKSCASIGSGDGEQDKKLLQACMPNVQAYYGVEPDKYSMNLLKENMAGLQDVTCHFYEGVVETWTGPNSKIDTIYAMLSLFYLDKESRLTFYRRVFTDWLNPGGSLIIVLNTPSAYPARIRAHFGTTVPTTETVRQEVETLGYKVCLDRSIALQGSHVDPNSSLELIRFIMCRDVTDEEKDEFPAFARSLDGNGHAFYGVLCIRQN